MRVDTKLADMVSLLALSMSKIIVIILPFSSKGITD